MHLVFLNQYYPPDAAPTGVMLQAVAEECTRQGHEVTVICAAGGYADGVKLKSEIGKAEIRDENPEFSIQAERGIHSASSSVSQLSTLNPQPSTSPPPTLLRLPATRFGRGTFVGKLLDYASYYVGVAWRLGTMNPPPDRIVALTTPPYLSVLARAVSKLRGADHGHWVMDLYPDVMVAHGMLAEGGWKHRLLAGLARWGFGGRRCAAVLTLGPDMAKRCERVVRGKEELSVVGDPLSERRLPGAEARPTTDNRQLITVSWVPLWGAGEKNEAGRDRRVGDNDAAGRSEHGLRRDAAATGLRVARGWQQDELVVMYSGNMGLGHRFGEILEIAREKTSERLSENWQGRVSDASGAGGANEKSLSVSSFPSPAPDLSECGSRLQNSIHRREAQTGMARVQRGQKGPCHGNFQTTDHRPPTTLQNQRFVFYGGGKRRGEIEAFMAAHPEAAVELHDYAPAEELSAHLMSADVHLVSLEPAWTGTMVPSKLQGIFAVGRPVVFVGSRESSIGRWVEESGGGWVVAAGDVEGLRAALDEARDPQVRRSRGEAAARFAKECFDRETNVRRVVEVLVGSRSADL